MTRNILITWLAIVTLASGLAGCSGGSGYLGATPGGSQDIALARRKIAEGIVPEPEDFVVEGLYAEHDLPLEGPPCTQVLCLSTATGIATAVDTGQQEVFVQVGMSSNVDPATFHRKPLDAALVIDRSGSMEGTPMDAVKEAARRLVTKLDENDTFSLVSFNGSASTLVKQIRVGDRKKLFMAIDTINALGGTCIECGVKQGFAQLASQPRDEARAQRLFLFTDAMPNVGATGESEFMTLLRENSTQGRDLTLFGVNLAFGQAFVTQVSSVRGANAYYLSDAERTKTVFDEDFDYLVTPIAYDLKLVLRPAPGLQVAAVYGLPGVAPGAAQAELSVGSVFLSRRHGALLVRLARTADLAPQQPVVTGQFGYQSLEGASSDTPLTARYEGSEPLTSSETWYSQRTVRKTVALTNFILGAQRASGLWRTGDKAEAREVADRTAAGLQAEADRLDDDPLRTEAQLARDLAALMVP